MMPSLFSLFFIQGRPMGSALPTAVPIRLAFTGSKAKDLYNGCLKPATACSVGTDLIACLDSEEIVLKPGERCFVPSGVRIQPKEPGWAGIVSSRSGLGAKEGVVVAQGLGLIDPDYTGEIVVVLLNTSAEVRRIKCGERIAQLFFVHYGYPAFEVVNELASTERGAGGFGHTGR